MRLANFVLRPASAWLALLLALVAVAALGSVGRDPAPVPTRPASRTAPPQVAVARASLACPAPEVATTTATTVVVAAPGLPGMSPDAAAGGTYSVVPPGGGTVRARRAGTGFLSYAVPASLDALAVRATDSAAPGLAASMLTRSTDATMRGLAGVSCGPSAIDTWFVGSGANIGQRGRVYLTNLEAAPAIVDLSLFGPRGPLDTPDGRGIVVPPGGQEVRLLDALAPGVRRFAVHVRARQGRIVPAVRDLQVTGLTPLGADWVPPAVAPARRVVVAGVPGGAGPRLLQLVAPGATDAIVRLRLVTPTGTVTPPEADVVDVRAGRVTEVDLAEVTRGQPVSVLLESDQPVTAGVLARVHGTEGQLSELAYTAASLPLTTERPGVVADVGIGSGTTRTLVLTAIEDSASVRLEPLPATSGEPREVSVPAGTVVSIDLATVTPTAGPVVVVPDAQSPPVYVTRHVAEEEARGPFLTSSPVQPGHYTVPVPRVVADLRVAVPTVSRRPR